MDEHNDIEFKWIGSQVSCYDPGLRGGDYDFYTSCQVNKETITVGDFVVISSTNTQNHIKICMLLSMYESRQDWHKNKPFRGTVRWYTFARDVPRRFFPNGFTFDRENEVIEDFRGSDIFISLEDIKKKCNVIFATLDDPVHLIKKKNLNKEIYYSCRYKLKDDLIPIFSDMNMDNLLKFEEFHTKVGITPLAKVCTPVKEDSKKNGGENQNRKNGLYGKDSETKLIKARNPTPNRKVKRNLNESFDSMPSSQESTPCNLNYSIIDLTTDSDQPIKLKLRASEKQCPIVLLNKFKENVFTLLNTNQTILKNNEKKIFIKELFGEDQVVNVTKLTNEHEKIKILKHKETSEKVEDENNKEIISSIDNNKIEDEVTNKNVKIPNGTISKICNKLEPKVIISNSHVTDSSLEQSDLEENQKPSSNSKLLQENFNCRRSSRLSVKHNLFDTDVSFLRKSTRISNKISYTEEFDSSLQKKPIKRIRKISTDSESSVSSILKSPRKIKTPLKTPIITPTKNVPDNNLTSSGRAKRNVNKPRKYCNSDEEESPKKIKRGLKIIEGIDANKDQLPQKLKQNCTPKKNISYEESIKISNGNREFLQQMKTPKHKNKEENLCKTFKPKTTGTGSGNIPKTPKRTILETEESHKTPKHKHDCDDYGLKTPRHKNELSVAKHTLSARAKMIREGVITPSIQSRITPIKRDATPLNKARTKLHVSYIPKALPCRENEFNDIFNFLEGKLLDGCGGCMYVSGVPGTGKTATTTEVIKKLQTKVQNGELPKFEFVGVNGMKLSEPRQSYVEILRQLTGKTVAWEQAQNMLDTKFTKASRKCLPIILLVDELDILCTKRQDVVYNLLDWPTKANAQLIVITIANTMDLPERLLMGRVTSRLGLTRLTFQPYTHKQLQEIVTKRLMGTDAFNPDAIQLVARKVASVSGDARRALDICRRAAELAETEGKNAMVSMGHVNEALNAMITQPKVRAIKHCSRLQQLVLQAVVSEVERTGVEETTFIDVYTMLVSVAALDGFQMVTCTVALSAVSKLGACRLLLTDQKSVDMNQKLILNVSPDDVYYALRQD